MEFRQVPYRARRQNHQTLRAQDHSRLSRSDLCYRGCPGFEIAPSPVLAYGPRGRSKASTPLCLFGEPRLIGLELLDRSPKASFIAHLPDETFQRTLGSKPHGKPHTRVDSDNKKRRIMRIEFTLAVVGTLFLAAGCADTQPQTYYGEPIHGGQAMSSSTY